ncbi:hypothetical protein AHAS_Ahas17G0140600 [Arachis hypogaea]
MAMKVQSNSFHIQHDSFSEAEHLNGKLLEGNTVAEVTGDKNAVHPYRGYSFTRALTDGKEDLGSLRLSSHQVSLLLSSIWVQATSVENGPANFEAMAHTFSISLLFTRSKVYFARTTNGINVAVKVQHPNLHHVVVRDVYILRLGLGLLQKIAKRKSDPRLYADELGKGFVGELDYTLEAANASKFLVSARLLSFFSLSLIPLIISFTLNISILFKLPSYSNFSSQNYFDPNGLFMSVLWSWPLLVIAMIILINTLFSLCYLIVRWKRAEQRHRVRIAYSKEE